MKKKKRGFEFGIRSEYHSGSLTMGEKEKYTIS